ncbi:MAG: hypothetical protein L0Z62_10835 [Gemmataceae bacterium]|nr:hypothetical protein [Gemmataceae bacterium]
MQQIACCYLRHGYWWYVTGRVPADKDPEQVDRKLLTKYAIAVSESTRARRKQRGQANLQYLRYQRRFVLLATRGQHPFFEAEAANIRDMRRCPLKIAGYAISYRRGGRRRTGELDPRWHAHVAIERQRYLELLAYFRELAVHRSAPGLALAFYQLPFEPYAPIRRQFLTLLREVNRARGRAGLPEIPTEVLPLRRRVVRPFGQEGDRRKNSPGGRDRDEGPFNRWTGRAR